MTEERPAGHSPRPEGGSLPPRVAAGLVFFASGAVLVIEVVGLRLVAPYVGVTLQTSSAVIGLSLGGIALGAWPGGRLADQAGSRRLLPIVLLLAGGVTLLLAVVLGLTPGRGRRRPAALVLAGFMGLLLPPLVPAPCGVETAYHCASVVPDPARATGRFLVMDSLLHSYVDLANPTYL